MPIQQDSSHPTGVVAVGSEPSGALSAARHRKADAALALRHQGLSWAEIAETIGYPTARAALIAVETALQRGLDTTESKDFMRTLAGKKLEDLIYAAYTKAVDDEAPDQATFMREARQLIMEHAKLYGYVAPTEVSIYNPSEMEVEELIGKLIKDKVPDIDTGDIFEMEEGDDGVFVPKTEEDIF